jgi:hypothetical protein
MIFSESTSRLFCFSIYVCSGTRIWYLVFGYKFFSVNPDGLKIKFTDVKNKRVTTGTDYQCCGSGCLWTSRIRIR